MAFNTSPQGCDNRLTKPSSSRDIELIGNYPIFSYDPYYQGYKKPRTTSSLLNMAPSKRIAVAGGTGGIGSHIVEGLLEIAQKHALHIIVLSRSSKPDIQYAGSKAPVIGVDSTSVEAIEKVLREHKIDTVISTLVDLTSPEAFEALQQRYLDASLKVPSVRRFAPSEFAVDSESLVSVKYYNAKIPILHALRKVKESRKDFEFTKFECGVFMNYFGFGNLKPDGEKVHGYLRHFPYIVDISKSTADVPGDGNAKFAFTTAEDVGRFTAAATQLDEWAEKSEMAGDVVSINEVIQIAERITGKKIEAKFNTEADIVARMDPNPVHAMTNFYLEVFLGMIRGEAPPGDVLNGLVDVKPMTVEVFLQKWWGK